MQKQSKAQILFYSDVDPYFQELPNELVGRIVKEAFTYAIRGKHDDTFDDLETVTKIFANQTIQKVKENADKYAAKCKKLGINGSTVRSDPERYP